MRERSEESVPLKIILKVKDEPELIDRWLEYHGSIVGFDNLIVFDCGSTDPNFLGSLKRYRDRISILTYDRYYDHLHQYFYNQELYDSLVGKCKYVTVLDADEFLFGSYSRLIHPSYVLDVLRATDLPCICGTWFSNFAPPRECGNSIEWRQPISFGIDDESVKLGSRQGKAIVRADYVSRAKYVGHNIGDARLSKFITPESFGKLGIFHLVKLSQSMSRRRSLQHLVSKGVAPRDGSVEETDNALYNRLKSSDIKPIERLYIARYFGSPPPTRVTKDIFQTHLLAGGVPEVHKELHTWFDFNYGQMLDEINVTMSDAEPTVIFEDNEIVVFWRRGQSDYLFVSFGDLISLAAGSKFYADAAVRKLDLSCIGFMAKRPNWFPIASVLAALPSVEERISSFRERIVYGGSMGGYAALKFSAALHATKVIAHCPQWSIDQSECGGQNPGWQNYFDSTMSGMGIRPGDISGQAYIFVDNLNRTDDFHAAMIQGADPTVKRFSMPLVGHHVISVFAGTQSLADVVAACRAGNDYELAQIAKRVRRSSAIYKQNLLKSRLGRFPVQVARNLLDTNSKEFSLIDEKLVLDIAAELAVIGLPNESAECLSRLQSVSRSASKQAEIAKIRMSLTSVQMYMTTVHGLVLAYSPQLGRCTQVARTSPLFGTFLLPVRVRQRAGIATLFYDAGSIGEIDLGVDERGHLSSAAASQKQSLFELSSSKAGHFNLKLGSNFLCAEPSGVVICNRGSAGEWEQLRFA